MKSLKDKKLYYRQGMVRVFSDVFGQWRCSKDTVQNLPEHVQGMRMGPGWGHIHWSHYTHFLGIFSFRDKMLCQKDSTIQRKSSDRRLFFSQKWKFICKLYPVGFSLIPTRYMHRGKYS